MRFTYQELSTVLAGLRMLQNPLADFVELPHFDDVEPLSADGIDALCERINCEASIAEKGETPAPNRRGMFAAAQHYCETSPAVEIGEGYWDDMENAYACGALEEQSKAAGIMRTLLRDLGQDAPAGLEACRDCDRVADGPGGTIHHAPDCKQEAEDERRGGTFYVRAGDAGAGATRDVAGPFADYDEAETEANKHRGPGRFAFVDERETEDEPDIPADFEVQPLEFMSPEYNDARKREALAQCGTCGRMWDDAEPTSYTPAPAGRCPFEAFHA